jgi:hypothetical protein
MKKNLTFLTGIVFIITILVAGSCGNGKKQNGSTKVADDSTEVKDDSTTVRVYLKDILIDGSMHLEMYDSKKPDCEVIDNLVTVVYPEYTVIWQKAPKSNINEVKDIRPIDDDGKIFSKGVIEVESLWTLEIPLNAKPDTVKYEIVFTVKGDTTTWIIDPYLKIPKQSGGGD